MTEKRDYPLCIDCEHQCGALGEGIEIDTWCSIKKNINCDEVFECKDFEEI